MTTDHHVPRYHLRPPHGYVNDPNGPVYVDGRWQLYFQYVSDTPRRGAVVWGHASSADLATWRYHRPALSPDPAGDDRDGCWSGNAVVSDGAIIAFYSGYRRGHPYQSVLAARSTDGGYSFGPPRSAVADPDPAEEVVEFRDPFVWSDDDRWLMLVGAGDAKGRASARLYESADLTTWHYRGPLVQLARTVDADADGGERGCDTGDMWECPQLLSFGDRDVLLVGAYTRTGGGITEVLSIAGRRHDGRMEQPEVTRFDNGANFYAASAMRDSPAGPLVWGWVTEGRSADWTVEADWSGMLSLPRVASLTTDGRLACRPADALHTLRGDLLAASDDSTSDTMTYDGVPPQVELELSLAGGDRRGNGVPPTRVSLRCGSDEHLDLVVDWSTGRMLVDRDNASQDPRAHRGVYAWQEPQVGSSEPLRLRWFVDGSVGELFTSSGQCSTVRFYPTAPPPWRLEITGLATGDSVRVWPLAKPGSSG